MTDESDPPPTVIAFPQSPTPRDAMSERGARTPPLPPPEPERPEKIGLFAADMTLRDLLTEVIRGDYSKLDWSVSEAFRLIDPGEKSPPLLRYAARMHMRKIAGEIALHREQSTMRSGASYAVIAFAPDRPEPPPPRQPEIPRRGATLKLDIRKTGVCNLCNRKHSEPTMFTLAWVDPVLGAEVTAQFAGECVAGAIRAALQRKGQMAAAREADKEAREMGFTRADLRQLRRDGLGPSDD
jgi:hypothetical protein